MTENKTNEYLLEGINSSNDIKKLDSMQLKKLAGEIRQFLIEKVSVTGGHLASNLGVVELTLALHKVFSTPEDKIVWDVGHQSYIHKIITGRREQFDTLRQLNGISGFPKQNESCSDCFNTGHSSTSISAALGIAKARDILKQQFSVVAVIGDGAMTGGMAFEALNDAGRSPNNFIIILNDNEMSISRNVGGFSRYLSKIRTQPIYSKAKEDLDTLLKKIPAVGKTAYRALVRAKGTIKYMVMPGVIFEELGLKYLGPIDGHDINELVKVFVNAKRLKGPVLIHIRTQKGKGYMYAEENPQNFHAISPFEIETGETKINNGPTFSDVFGSKMVKLAQIEPGLAAITAAMPLGTGLDEFSKKYPKRFFDVGIAEQHAVTFAAGLAKAGIKPVFAVYSTFLQRSYDQILHDVALQKLHVVLAIDRAGIVGEDGETHQGLYDISFLNHIPNMTIAAPCDYTEFENLLEYAVLKFDGPIAIRYPRGTGQKQLIPASEIRSGKGVKLISGNDVSIIAIGNMVETALNVAIILKDKGISADVINARFIKPLDEKLILESAAKTGVVVTVEDNSVKGGFGSSILELINKSSFKAKTAVFGFPDIPILHGSRKELYKKYGLDKDSLSHEIVRMLRNK
jgi:1-deoxy-D-xylulose-5-phosphate synthase